LGQQKKEQAADVVAVVNDDNHDTGDANDNNNGILLLEDGKQESVSQPDQLKRRSILNPHGLEDEPRPTQMERRSQSRERRRSSSRGRHRTREIPHHQQQQQPPTTAEDLLNRRREMRQRIAERQSNASQSRTDRRRRMSSGDRSRAATEENDDLTRRSTDTRSSRRHGRSRSKSRRSRSKSRSRAATDEKSECNNSRRGRSRSAVRDTFSKIRSASLTFRKKDIGIDLDDEDLYTIDTGKRSTGTSLSKRLLSKKEKNSKPRSLSGGRRNTLQEWGGISEPHIFDESMGSGNFPQSVAKSENLTRQSSRLGMFKKSSEKKLSGIRSLSRGKFRDTDLESADTFTERGNVDLFTSWEMAGSQRSVSSTGRRQWRSGNEFNDF